MTNKKMTFGRNEEGKTPFVMYGYLQPMEKKSPNFNAMVNIYGYEFSKYKYDKLSKHIKYY